MHVAITGTDREAQGTTNKLRLSRDCNVRLPVASIAKNLFTQNGSIVPDYHLLLQATLQLNILLKTVSITVIATSIRVIHIVRLCIRLRSYSPISTVCRRSTKDPFSTLRAHKLRVVALYIYTKIQSLQITPVTSIQYSLQAYPQYNYSEPELQPLEHYVFDP